MFYFRVFHHFFLIASLTFLVYYNIYRKPEYQVLSLSLETTSILTNSSYLDEKSMFFTIYDTKPSKLTALNITTDVHWLLLIDFKIND